MQSTHPAVAVPTYGLDEANKLRQIGASLFNAKRPANVPRDIYDADYPKRVRLYHAMCELADEIESAPGPVEIELVLPGVSPYSVEDSRDIFYLLRTALV